MFCVIPARGGSRRIPKKNIKPFFGRPIIEYSINAAKESLLFSKIIVSTDDDEIKQAALNNGVEVHDRNKHLSQDHIGTQEVVTQVIKDVDSFFRGHVCTLYPCAPMVTGEVLCKAAEHVKGCMHLVSVGVWLQDPGQFYFSNVKALFRKTPLLSTYTRLFPIDPDTAIDINTPEDWFVAETMYMRLHGT